MPSFMSLCRCGGQRPEGVVSNRHYARPDLIAKLLRERHVARFVVAPTGFGKSSLAFEYADVVFAFRHVFWINGRSPCFLRDLDNATLLNDLLLVDDSPRLVVCEDVPLLDSNRVKLFGEFLDNLLDRDIEVLVTCIPSVDSLSFSQRDRIYLNGFDLLLTEDEMIAEEMGGRLRKEWNLEDSCAQRIPCVRWGKDGFKTLLSGLKKEEISGDMRLAMLALFILGIGSLEDLKMFIPADRIDETATMLENNYPLFGIKGRTKTYHTIDIDTKVIAENFCPRIDEIVSSSIYKDRDTLCNCFADALLAREDAIRACSFMKSFASKATGGMWLAKRGWDIIALNAPASFCELFETVRRSVTEVKDTLDIQRAWAVFILDDVSLALTLARRIAKRGTSISAVNRVCLFSLLVGKGHGEVQKQAREILKNMVSDKFLKNFEISRNPSDDSGDGSHVIDWVCFARIAYTMSFNIVEGVQEWNRICKSFLGNAPTDAQSDLQQSTPADAQSGLQQNAQSSARQSPESDQQSDALPNPDTLPSPDALPSPDTLPNPQSNADNESSRVGVRAALLLAASWILNEIVYYYENNISKNGADESIRENEANEINWLGFSDLARMAEFVSYQLSCELPCRQLSWFSLCAGISLENMLEMYPHLVSVQIPLTVTTALHRDQIAFLKQKETYRKKRNVRDEEMRAFRATHDDGYHSDAVEPAHGALSKVGVPTLHVMLFGSDEVRIGEHLIDQTVLRRRKARVALAILVLNHGREITKDKLASALWPDSKIEIAQKNFNSVWSQLKHALSLQDERGCPYLIRSTRGCRVDARFVSSDAFVFEDLCRTLLFGTVGVDGWERLYAQVCEDYAEDLMPYEKDNEIIISLRQRYRMQLIDSLLAASSRLRKQGEARGSLWFAREALRRDSTREDVYVTLMEAQIASNQRSSALETYFSCRRFLSEELGIDPSARVIELYRSIIETEETLI